MQPEYQDFGVKLTPLRVHVFRGLERQCAVETTKSQTIREGFSKTMDQVYADDLAVDLLHVMPGYRCNLTCTHCVNNSGPNRTTRLTLEELERVKDEVRVRRPKRLIFTGGEPTLHADLINSILSAHPDLDDTHVLLTTNGW